MDLLVTVADARSPDATDLSNSLPISFGKKGVKILSLTGKIDLSDINPPNSFNFKQQKNRSQILSLIREALGVNSYAQQGYKPHLQVLIAGFPNTGKSTLINLLKGKRVAVAENLPGKNEKDIKIPHRG